MANETVTFDYSLYQANCSFSDVEEAIKNITASNEKQFESIKKEKWYHRLFNCVTFSQKGKKRMADQISSLAQAQQVLMDILVRLSAQDAQIALYINQNIQDIRRLSENDLYLQEQIKQLELTVTMGIRKIDSVKDLSVEGRQILFVCLVKLCDLFDYPSSEQQEYANNVFTFINEESEIVNLSSAIENIDESSRRIIIGCCLEYIFLYHLDFDYSEKVSEFIDEFDIGNKTLRALQNRVQSTYDLIGEDGLINKYNSRTQIIIPNEFIYNYYDDGSTNVMDSIIEQILVPNIKEYFTVANTDDYILMVKREIGWPHAKESNPSFIKINKRTKETSFPYSDDELIKQNDMDIFAAGVSEELWLTYQNKVLAWFDGGRYLFLNLNDDTATIIDVGGKILAYTKDHVVVHKGSQGQLVDCCLHGNGDKIICDSITENMLKYGLTVNKFFYTDEAFYFLKEIVIDENNSKLVLSKYTFIDGTLVENDLVLPNASQMLKTPIDIERIKGLFVSDDLAWLLWESNQITNCFDIVRINIKEPHNIDIISSDLFIYKSEPITRQSSTTDYLWTFVTERCAFDAHFNPTFTLAYFDFNRCKVVFLMRGCGKMNYQDVQDSKESLTNRLKTIEEMNKMAPLLHRKPFYTSSEISALRAEIESPYDHYFYVNTHRSIIDGYLFTSLGNECCKFEAYSIIGSEVVKNIY